MPVEFGSRFAGDPWGLMQPKKELVSGTEMKDVSLLPPLFSLLQNCHDLGAGEGMEHGWGVLKCHLSIIPPYPHLFLFGVSLTPY